jgi:hypothetical protein
VDTVTSQARLRALADYEVRQVPLPPGYLLSTYEYGGGHIAPYPGYAIEVLNRASRVGRTHVIAWDHLATRCDVTSELQLIIHELQLAHLRATNTTSSATTTNTSNSQNRNDTATTT